MKRSEVNGIMREALGFLQERSFVLPPFALWSPVRTPRYGLVSVPINGDVTVSMGTA